MKMKHIMMTGIFLLGLMIMSTQEASAQTWARVSIDEVGASTAFGGIANAHFTHLHDNPQFANKYFNFATEVSKEMLATCLTAISLGKNVWIRIKSDGSTIDRIRMITAD